MEKDFDKWNKKKKKIEYYLHTPNFREGDLWWYSAGLNIGVEINGKNKKFERPVYILFKCSKEMFIGIPCTTTIKQAFYLYMIFKNEKYFTLNLSQIRAMSSKRLIKKITHTNFNKVVLNSLINYLKRTSK